MKKVIVVGLDGLEPKLAEPMLQAGELPNLARLRQQGGFSRIRTTYPAQTPVAWSSFSTGTNPGGHGIFDFLGRDPRTYLPTLGLNQHVQKSSFMPPKAVNMRRGTPLWDLLTEAGIPSAVVRCPCTYPPDKIRGQMLSGVGVPDLRGGMGTSTFFTSADGVKAGESERVIQVQRGANNTVTMSLQGPRHPKTGIDTPFDITVHLDPAARRAALRSQGSPKELELREGQWSDWLKVKFKMGLLQSLHGMVRFHLVQIEPVFELYVSPINFDPDMPMFPISNPPDYASILEERIGTFYTTGMVEDHQGLQNERFGEEAYLAQCADVLREREQMMRYELERLDQGFFFCLFDTPDRMQHMFWRFREPTHPANQGDIPPDMKRAIEEHYRTCDGIVGKALRYVDDETLCIVLSDHGMNSFQRGLHVNSWLYEQGLLALKPGMQPGEEAGDFFHAVDWSRTRAYALGLGGIYLNIKGREEQGVVEAGDVEKVKAAIAEGLTGLGDPGRGKAAVRSVLTREQLYSGPYASESPDLLINFEEGYRVSWDTTLGGIPEGIFEDNTHKWSGDHTIDPALAPGVLFMNRPFNDDASLLDLAPTILSALGVPKGAAMEGKSLLK